jgi:hypothetical protein
LVVLRVSWVKVGGVDEVPCVPFNICEHAIVGQLLRYPLFGDLEALFVVASA